MKVVFTLVFALFAYSQSTQAQTIPVDLELVLAADGSGSIDDIELALQRDGYATAVTNDQVLALLTGGLHGKTAIAYVEWGDALSQATIVDWTVIDGPESAQAFAEALRSAPREAWGYNSISAAIDYSVTLMETNPHRGIRRIIDISGDGPNIGGRPVTDARDDAVAMGITINALVINSGRGGYRGPGGIPLDVHYQRDVIGGIGSFVKIAERNENFAEAVIEKMLLEIADSGAPIEGVR
ncbi:MAG: DUF1194 domain-containing protein [Alphaproteobacteria bacterium]|nr:DUF1194 domain-containing protein [Alphaproteobacteria bacterium]